ncbi:hypothetical protein CM19_01260 [Candidatus Acidianus copahuensis]|uniref:Uncharacterized protein n=1 Tax=Candidatus Acidianus copahuensis TaxID=1160895 RepID=A0A031LSS4_9CREN|nr:hypothetical protein [Candidatus Acidianus copahuensis]EZQ11432.1 hypothetical protein CM19_01260 [Candidatus Acidianus copahuensis]
MFNLSPSLFGNSQVTPSFANSFKIGVNGTYPKEMQSAIIYSESLQVQFQGNVPIWNTTTGSVQEVTFSGSDPVFVEILLSTPQLGSSSYIEVGYLWL